MAGKILIVDDEPHMLRLIELSLKRGGYEVIPARHGREALALIQQELPVLIVIDVTMPEMDGITVLKHLKASSTTAAIPVIVLTTRGQTLSQREAESAGAALYLTKPFSPSALAAEARRLIASAEPN